MTPSSCVCVLVVWLKGRRGKCGCRRLHVGVLPTWDVCYSLTNVSESAFNKLFHGTGFFGKFGFLYGSVGQHGTTKLCWDAGNLCSASQINSLQQMKHFGLCWACSFCFFPTSRSIHCSSCCLLIAWPCCIPAAMALCLSQEVIVMFFHSVTGIQS